MVHFLRQRTLDERKIKYFHAKLIFTKAPKLIWERFLLDTQPNLPFLSINWLIINPLPRQKKLRIILASRSDFAYMEQSRTGPTLSSVGSYSNKK